MAGSRKPPAVRPDSALLPVQPAARSGPVPESKEPEPKVPEPKLSRSKVPESKEHGFKVPESKEPEPKVPESKRSGFKVPEFKRSRSKVSVAGAAETLPVGTRSARQRSGEPQASEHPAVNRTPVPDAAERDATDDALPDITAPAGAARINPARSNVSMLVLPQEPRASSPTATVIEFPRPAARPSRRRLWITLASLAAAVALVVAVVVYSPLLALRTITVDGNKLASGAAIQAALAPLKNKPLPQVDQTQVARLLAPMQQIRSVSVEARPPSTLLVHVVERVPVALLKSGQQYIMVDPEGVQLGTTADPASVPLPLIDGGTAAIGQATFKAMTDVLAALPPSILAKLEHASASSPDAVELTLNDGKTIIWGNASDRELKAKVVQALVNAPPPVQEAGKPVPAPVKVYDVSAPRHPVTR